MILEDKKIKKILLQGGYATEDEIEAAEEFTKRYHRPMVDYFLSEKKLTNDLLGQAIAESFKVPYADLNSHQPLREQILRIPEKIAKKYRVVLFSENEKEAVITTDNPGQSKLSEKLKNIFKSKKIRLTYSLSEDIDAVFINYCKSLETRFSKIIGSETRVAPEIIEEIFDDALAHQTSDIHLEPRYKDVIVRFRVDGVLYEAGRIPKNYYENILNRIKVQARLRIDEHQTTQDGAIRYIKDDQTIDMRVSIVPVLDGEKVTIRILSQYVRNYSLDDLGLSASNQDILLESSRKPFGMILVSGPTGSGKSTTLYALLKSINRPEVNITTIEEPVEYHIAGTNQIQVNHRTGITFAKGLRSIVRQDPDIIFVGEIRDEETAEISVNAALTGHLLFSTFHANDAATSIPRLLDMNIEPFLLASTLNVVIAQRLVRKICENCRYSERVKIGDIEKVFLGAKKFFSNKKITLYKGKGCNTCSNTGFKGRTAIFEFIPISREIQDLVLKDPSTQQIWDLAKKQGAISLFEDGLDKVKRGITTLEELLRVAQPQG